MRYLIDLICEASVPIVFWHGSPSGDLRGSHYGLHLGSRDAAREALEARIGVRADGHDWDGGSEYGKTMLAGSQTLKRLGRWATGFNARLPVEDFLPENGLERAVFSNREQVALTARPSIQGYHIVGAMKNKPNNPLTDDHANRWMIKQKAMGTADRGCYYDNEGEDAGSVSAVVPDGSFVKAI
jgi:hypothetical protein